jgi:4-amino-4-deoxy-L-arabinose transferase
VPADRALRADAAAAWRARARVALLLAALLLYACAFQGTRPLYSPDEGRYTDVALAMLDSGDWLRPMLNHEFEHWSKPPLTYWAIAASVAAFGHHEFAVRLPGALAFALTTLLLVPLGRRFVPAQPWLPAWVYATFAFPPAAANLVTTDTLLTLWESAQLAAFASLWWAADPQSARRMRRLLWLAAALAFMTKGPPGLLPLAASAAFAGLRGGWRGLRRIAHWDGLLAFLLVGGGWYAYVALHEPGLMRYFLVEEVVNRVASDKMHRNAEWYGAFKVYLPTLVLGTLPWLVPFARAAWRRRAGLAARIRASDEAMLLACWLLPLAVFALSRSRLPLYVLPLFAPLALIVARALAPLRPTPAQALALGAWCLLAVLARVVPARLDVGADDRRLAEALAAELPVAPFEVLFVDTAPRFGLRFYLGSEVERMHLPERTPAAQSEAFAQEMAEDEGCRVLLAEPDDRAALERRLVDAGIAYRRLADARGYAVLALGEKSCPRYADAPR